MIRGEPTPEAGLAGPSWARVGVVMATFLAFALVTGGCSDDDTDTRADSTATTAAVEEHETIEVTALDYGYQDLPTVMPAGATLSLHNASTTEAHELVAFDLPPDETRSAAEIFALPQASLGPFFQGDPNLVLIAPPGQDAFVATGDGTLTRPGRYLVFCAIPTGGDPDEYVRQARESNAAQPHVEGGPPHFTQGMYAELTVE